jgi:hypothetical protein
VFVVLNMLSLAFPGSSSSRRKPSPYTQQDILDLDLRMQIALILRRGFLFQDPKATHTATEHLMEEIGVRPEPDLKSTPSGEDDVAMCNEGVLKADSDADMVAKGPAVSLEPEAQSNTASPRSHDAASALLQLRGGASEVARPERSMAGGRQRRVMFARTRQQREEFVQSESSSPERVVPRTRSKSKILDEEERSRATKK